MKRYLNLFFIIMVLTAAGYTQAPNFDYGYLLSNEDGYMADGNAYVAPEIGDWDDDGDLDIMLGVFFNGNIWYYENIATGPEPQFASMVEVYANGVPIQVTYS